MIFNNLNYRKSLELSFIIVLFTTIIFLFFFPKNSFQNSLPPVIEVTEMVMVNIPRTWHPLNLKSPVPLKPVIPIAADEIDILDEVDITIEELEASFFAGGGNGSVQTLPIIPPRQLLEVFPEKQPGNIMGKLIISLKINQKGKVDDHKILESTINDPGFIKKILDAIYKTKWQPAVSGEKKTDYWVEKTYSFSN